MPVSMAFLYEDRLYFLKFHHNSTVRIGKAENCHLRIQELNQEISIVWKGSDGVIHYSDGKTKKAVWNQSVVLDVDQKAACFFSEYQEEIYKVALPENGTVYIGRNDKAEIDGVCNDIVLSKAFISGRHCSVSCQNGEIFLKDLQSTNGVYRNGKRIGEAPLQTGDTVSLLTVRIKVEDGYLVFKNVGKDFMDRTGTAKSAAPGFSTKSSAVPVFSTGEVVFKRSPRLKEDIPQETVEILAPPPAGQKPEINWLSTLLPAGTTIAAAIVMTVLMNNMMSLFISVPMAVAGVIVSVFNYRKQGKTYDAKISNREEKYSAYIAETEEKLKENNRIQKKILNKVNPDIKECLSIVQQVQPRLWERTTHDGDFLTVRLGHGTMASSTKITVPKVNVFSDEDFLMEKAQDLYERYRQIDGAPIVCDLLRHPLCGVVGTDFHTEKLIKNMMVQVATHHFYSDVRIICIADESRKEDLQWLEGLPHISREVKAPQIAFSKAEANRLFEAYAEILNQRRNTEYAQNSYGKTPLMLPYFLFIILQPEYLDRSHPINEFLFRQRLSGIGTVMVVEELSQLPKECEQIITLEGEKGTLFHSEDTAAKVTFTPDEAQDGDYKAFGAKIRVIRCEEKTALSSIPQKFTFFDMYGVKKAEELPIQKLWSESDVLHSLSVPIGVALHKKTVSLDLHESAHGPHGLVAGTTGSGKSELLQSFILSLALHFSPLEVGFLLIDFKGGGLANQFRGLPHLMGTITNIEDSAIDRSLSFIKAEQVRRQKIFSNLSVQKIDEYYKLLRMGRVKEPIPHLMIIVDEFAELKAEHPDFMKELISVSHIGRSLGIHLILATQKPAGQVSEQIWSNSQFKLCLKVATKEDSSEVLKVPDAFNIKEPGRAYLQVGNNVVFELFQSAYSGAETPNGYTQSEEVIRVIRQYCEEQRIPKMPPVCLPELPSVLPFTENREINKKTAAIAVGVYDVPEEQRQSPYILSLANNNVMIVGSSQSGKTNMLALIIRRLAENYSPEEVAIYIVDCASMTMKQFENLNHVGGVVTLSEDEKLKNLMKLLLKEIEIRKQKFFEAKVGSFASYRETGRTDMPHIVVLIDNLTVLKKTYFMDDAELLYLCQEGARYGISVVATCTQSAGFSYKYYPCFSYKIAFYNNNSGEYMNLFEHCRKKLPNIPGRGFTAVNNKLYQCQTYLAFDGRSEQERFENMQMFVFRINSLYGRRKAYPIPSIPKTVTKEYLRKIGTAYAEKPNTVILGVNYDTVTPVALDFSNIGTLAVIGKEKEKRRKIIQYLAREISGTDKRIYILDDIEKSLKNLRDENLTAGYAFLPEQGSPVIKEIEEILRKRYEAVVRGETEDISKEPLLVLIVNGREMAEALSKDKSCTESLHNICTKYKNMNVCVWMGDFPNALISYSSPEIFRIIGETKRFIYGDELSEYKISLFSSSVVNAFKKHLDKADAYYIKDMECAKIKMPIE